MATMTMQWGLTSFGVAVSGAVSAGPPAKEWAPSFGYRPKPFQQPEVVDHGRNKRLGRASPSLSLSWYKEAVSLPHKRWGFRTRVPETRIGAWHTNAPVNTTAARANQSHRKVIPVLILRNDTSTASLNTPVNMYAPLVGVPPA